MVTAASTSQSSDIIVRATVSAAADSAKTLELKNPLTLLGSRRRADIVLPRADAARAHAVIVNTGREVLLADLMTEKGTRCNGKRVRIHVLRDGDIIQIGSTETLINLHKPKHLPPVGNGPFALTNPFMMPVKITLVGVGQHERWTITDSIALIGSRSSAQVNITDEDLPLAHSVIFATTRGIAIQDLGSSKPLKMRGREQRFGYLKHRDRILVGGAGLMVQFPDEEEKVAQQENFNVLNGTQAMNNNQQLPAADQSPPSPRSDLAMSEVPAFAADQAGSQAGVALGTLEQKISSLQQDIAQSWGQLNEWKQRLLLEQNETTHRAQDLDNKEKMLEQLTGEMDQRAKALEQVEQTKQDLAKRETEQEDRCSELARLARDLSERESDVERFAAEYKDQRKELEKLQGSVTKDQKTLEENRQALDELQSELEAKATRLSKREAELQTSEEEFRLEDERMQAARQEFEQRERKIQQREEQLQEYEVRLTGMHETVTQRSEHIEERSVIIDRFGQFLEEANEAFQVTVNSPVSVEVPEIPGVPEPIKKAADARVQAGADTTEEIRNAVGEEQGASRPAVEHRDEETTIEQEPALQDSAVPEAIENQSDDSAAFDAEEVDSQSIDPDSLEPEVGKKFRLLRRLGKSGKSDAELVEQIRKELKKTKAGSAMRKKSKGWWRK